MTDFAVSYAQALYELGCEENISKEIFDDLTLACSSINHDYKKLMDAPDISLEEKEKLLDSAFSNSVNAYTLNFFKLLAKNKAFAAIDRCKNEYEKKYNFDNNIEKAEVVSAVALNAQLLDKLTKKLEDTTKKTVLLTTKVDPSVLGGLIIKFDNMLLDASVKSKLESIKRQIFLF